MFEHSRKMAFCLKAALHGLCLTGLFLLYSNDAHAQSAHVKIGNAFGKSVELKSISIQCKDWTCTPPAINGLFGSGDSLEFEFTSLSGSDELVTVTLKTSDATIETKQMLRAAATAAVETAVSRLFVSPVWPNPAKDNLSFNVHGIANRELHAYIYDLQGKEIFTRIVDRDGAVTLNLPSMPEGRYYFMLRDGMETLTMQEIKVSK
jgi:hypothetical protein